MAPGQRAIPIKIGKCIESVLVQTCPNFELILIDDGSEDSTFDICKKYAKRDSRVKVIHKENGGHTSARNEGLKKSRGKYILFLDSDDWLDIRTLEICPNDIESIGPDVIVFGMKNSTAACPFPVLISDGYYEMGDNLLWDKLLMGEDGSFLFPKSLSAKCFKREIIFESQLSVPTEIVLGEDGAAFIGAILRTHGISVIASDKRACYNCLVRPNSVSRTADGKEFQRVEILLAYYEKLLPLEKFSFSQQFDRYIVAQLYTALLFVIRSGAERKKINTDFGNILKNPVVSSALKKAKFSLKGYKYLMKKYILRHRLWGLAKILDK